MRNFYLYLINNKGVYADIFLSLVSKITAFATKVIALLLKIIFLCNIKTCSGKAVFDKGPSFTVAK